MSAGQIVDTTYQVAEGLNELKRRRRLIDEATYQAVRGHLLDAQETLTLIDDAARLAPRQRDEALADICRRIDEANEASLCGTDELKWAGAGHLALRPKLAVQLGLALWAELGHSWHRLTGTYDIAPFCGARLAPIIPSRTGSTGGPISLGMPGRRQLCPQNAPSGDAGRNDAKE